MAPLDFAVPRIFCLSGLDQNSLPWLAVKFPLSVFLGWLTYIISCAFIVYSAFQLASIFLFFVQSNFSV
jgi:hypothetical protein